MTKPHALIIEDDSFNLEVLSRLLAVEGVTSTLVQDATEVEAVLETLTQLDVIFLDLEMPKVNGYQMFEFLRETLGINVPIVACTVHTNEIDTARDLGFHSFIGKPLDQKRFSAQIKHILNNQPVWEI